MHAKRAATATIDHKLQRYLSGRVQNPHTFSMGCCRSFTPDLVRDIIMQVSHLGLTALMNGIIALLALPSAKLHSKPCCYLYLGPCMFVRIITKYLIHSLTHYL